MKWKRERKRHERREEKTAIGGIERKRMQASLKVI